MNGPARTDLRVLLATLAVAVTGLAFAPSSPARAAGAHHVTMSGYAFHPAALALTAGSTVIWTNQDTAPHDVEITSGPQRVHSPMLSKGASWSFTFTAPGSYAYVCTVHPGMDARLVVQAAPTTAAPARTRQAAAAPAHTPHMQNMHHSPHMATAAAPPTRTGAAKPVAPARRTQQPPQSAAAPQPTAPAIAPQTAASAAPARPLQPLLVLAGIVAGVSVVCLLLVGSRSASAKDR